MLQGGAKDWLRIKELTPATLEGGAALAAKEETDAQARSVARAGAAHGVITKEAATAAFTAAKLFKLGAQLSLGLAHHSKPKSEMRSSDVRGGAKFLKRG